MHLNRKSLIMILFVFSMFLSGCGLYNKSNVVETNTTLKWVYTTGAAMDSSPAVDNSGVIYIGSQDGNIYAINSDGTLKWTYTTGGWVESSPVINSGGVIYFGARDKNLYTLGGTGSLANTSWPMTRHDLLHTGRK